MNREVLLDSSLPFFFLQLFGEPNLESHTHTQSHKKKLNTKDNNTHKSNNSDCVRIRVELNHVGDKRIVLFVSPLRKKKHKIDNNIDIEIV